MTYDLTQSLCDSYNALKGLNKYQEGFIDWVNEWVWECDSKGGMNLSILNRPTITETRRAIIEATPKQES